MNDGSRSLAVVRSLSLVTGPGTPLLLLYLVLTGRYQAAAVVTVVGLTIAALQMQAYDRLVVVAQRRTEHLRKNLTLAQQDPVTGLAIRRVAEQHLTDTAGTDVTVALLDVDGMHDINAAHTHDGGDAMLAVVAARLTEASLPGDVIARLGGDEFVLITVREPGTVASALSAVLARPARLGNLLLPMRVSVGICRLPGGDPHTALSCADRAMFTAKRRRSRIEHYDPARDGAPYPPGARPQVRLRDRRPADRADGPGA